VSAKRLIVNADDLGASAGVNRGIFEAHERGVVTSASLLVTAGASLAAAELARGALALSVGLHVDLGGWSGTPNLEDELAGQAARFETLMGRPPTHLDSHRDAHEDPRWLPAFVGLAERLRIPLRGHSGIHRVASFYGQWGGESHPEQVRVESLARILAAEIDQGTHELSCHPGYADGLASSYCAEREIELATLCDPRARRAVEALGIDLVSHQDLSRESSAR
jgi:predicted glycoside hydrolase/deacetylase ChbG (UPF0249 family)